MIREETFYISSHFPTYHSLMKNPSSPRPASSLTLWRTLLLFCFALLPLRAEQFGIFNYTITGTGAAAEVTINGLTTDYGGPNSTTSGPLVIPAIIADLPVTTIASDAFSSRRGLTSVVFPASLVRINNGAFGSCSGLTSVSLPTDLTFLGDESFLNCTGLTSASLPASLNYFGVGVFRSCTGLQSINTISGSLYFESSEGVLYNKSRTLLVCYPTGKSGGFTCPSGVVSIREKAFSGCMGLTSVFLSAGLTSIGSGAFSSCGALSSVSLPTTLTSIGNYTFGACGSLASVILPNSITSIDYGAFAGCGLTNVSLPEGLTNLGAAAFYSCGALETVAFSQSCSSIGVETFYGCKKLVNITFPANLTTIGPRAFQYCEGLTHVSFPAGLTSIGAAAFDQCSGLIKATLPSGLTSLGAFAFSECIGLTDVFFPDGFTSLAGDVFYKCTGLTFVTFPDSIRFNGYNAFSGCSGLMSVVFRGDRPLLGTNFDSHSQFTVYYLSGKIGWERRPILFGHDTIMIDEATQPAAIWLLEHGQTYNASLGSDANSDGVSLLMAYALDLDPRLNLASSLPRTTLQTNTLGLTFHATRPGLTYRVEASSDLAQWSAVGVTQSAPGADGLSTATIPRSGPNRFLRLAVVQ
jgi:BspA type Leucine rich repeat region (6 copies)